MVTKISVVISLVTLAASVVFGQSGKEYILTTFFKDFPDDGPEYGRVPLLNRKIVFSAQHSIAEHPYVANILFRGGHYLTGVVLNRNVVLTTAHRIIGTPTELLTVVVGETFNDRGGPQHRVILKVIHSLFNLVKLTNNLGLLRMFAAFEYRSEVKSLPLFDMHDKLEDGSNGFVTGWGRCDSMIILTLIRFDWHYNEVDITFHSRDIVQESHVCLPRELVMYRGELRNPGLMNAYIKVNDSNSEECVEGYAKMGVTLGPGQLCAGAARVDEVMAPCLAVPGAPLAVRGRLLGLLSWGWGCGHRTDLPLVYSDVRYYNEWISSNADTLTNKVGLCASRTLYAVSMARVFRNASVPFVQTDNNPRTAMLPLLPLFLNADIYI